ncbi:hypothetical protein LXL04_006997 [Taraxacum kok-saghyz]
MLSRMRQKIEDVPELMQLIQSRLPLKEATRTTVLSKSWLAAWSTIPTLRFHVVEEQKHRTMTLRDMDHTLTRYLRDKIPITRLELNIDIENPESASHAEILIGRVATETCLKELFLSLHGHSFTLPDELLLGEKLTKIKVVASHGTNISGTSLSVRMTTSLHPVIKCVSLRELYLHSVYVSEEALNHILSSCTLLVKIHLINLDHCFSMRFKTIKVKNLPHLYELNISLHGWQSTALEISDVPNLHMFSYQLFNSGVPLPFNANVHSMSLSSVRDLELHGVVPDNECLDMIKSRFPFLESLTLQMTTWMLGSFHFTCYSIKIFSLVSCRHKKLTDVHIYAPKLRYFSFTGYNLLPNLLFPISTSLRKIELSLRVNLPIDASFFVKMREALTIAPKCNICITYHNFGIIQLDIDMADLRRRLLFPPATNVQQLEFVTNWDDCLWERSPFFDAFFEICHPMHVIARPDTHFRRKNHFSRLMLKEVLENKGTTAIWPHHLKHVQIRPSLHKKWKTLTNSQRRFLHGPAPVDFKLKWH